MDYRAVMEVTSRIIDAVGVVATVIGLVAATVAAFLRWRRRRPGVYRRYRRDLGRSILIGLEFLVAGDIIRTVAIEPTFENVGVLGLLILVRTLLSIALEVEIDGRWPWRRPDDESRGASGS